MAGGYSTFTEVHNFVQDDLCNFDVMVLDAYSTIWIWTGNRSNKFEQKGALNKVDMYKASLTDGRDPKTQAIAFVEPGMEPLQFTALFPEWEDEVSAKWIEKPAAEAKPAMPEKVEVPVNTDDLTKYPLDVLQKSLPDGVKPD